MLCSETYINIQLLYTAPGEIRSYSKNKIQILNVNIDSYVKKFTGKTKSLLWKMIPSEENISTQKCIKDVV